MSQRSFVTSPGMRMARPGPGKGWRPTKASRQAELAAQCAHLVLEQFAQRLDQLHVHPLGQAADIVVALDRHRRPAGEADALDHVRIERALGEEIGAADLPRLRLEDVDEGLADELALGLGLVEPGEAAEELVGGVHMDQRDVVMVAEQADDLLGLVRPHQAVIDEDAGELVADRLVDQHRGDGAVDAARQAADHPALPDLGADVGDLGRANSAIVQSPARPQTWRTKLASNLPPSGVCTTSGWNIRLKKRRCSSVATA
jgi:hypothetical protein